MTTYKPEDLNMLRKLLGQTPEPITKAGLHPTAEQIELYAYHLPNSTLSNLVVSKIIFAFYMSVYIVLRKATLCVCNEIYNNFIIK